MAGENPAQSVAMAGRCYHLGLRVDEIRADWDLLILFLL